MKKSEEIRIALENLEAEKDITIKQMVFENPTRTAENYDQLWSTYWRAFGRAYADKKDTLEWELRKARNSEVEIGDGVTEYLYSDAHAFTVIAKTKKTITIQRDKAILDPNFKPEWIAGGFAGHCTNQEDQTYTYERNPTAKRSDATGASAWVATQPAVTRALRLALAATSFTTTTSKLPPREREPKGSFSRIRYTLFPPHYCVYYYA